MRWQPVLVVALFALLARSVVAQVATPIGVSAKPRAVGATVSGVVHDSIARMPLAGAWVQLVATDSQAHQARTVVSDSVGRYSFDDVPDGRYALGFFHPMLDSLGVEVPVRDVSVMRQRSVRADLAIPSASRLRAAICDSRSAPSSRVAVGGIVVGVVRDARDRTPAAGVTVMAEWLEFTFRPGGVDRRRPRLVVKTVDNGWFAVCNVPSGGTMFVSASRGADSTDLIEVQVPAEGFVRLELYLGPARTVVIGDTTRRADTLAPPNRRVHLGDGRLRGTVVTMDENRPLIGALVRITDGPQARANERGEWVIADAPVGTRMLEVRAVGYYPVRRAVDVVTDAAPVRIALSTFKAVLETVRITAARVADRQNSGFEDRRRTGMGRYLSAEDLVRRGVSEVSDVFKNLPGVRLEYDSLGVRRIYVRSAFGDYCEPAFYIDGLLMFTLAADDVDGMVNAKAVRAIEVYNESTVPPQFQQALSGCGTIVIWRK